MQRVAVESEALLSIGYDAARRDLTAEFHDGDIYEYFEVPLAVWQEFFSAPSKGEFFAHHIRDHYKYRKIKAG